MNLASLVTILQPFGGAGAGASPPTAQTFRKALRAKLLSLADVTQIVGAAVYPGALPQSHDLQRDGPAVTYLVHKMPVRQFGGAGHILTGSDGTQLCRVVLTAYGFTFAQVDAIALVLFDQLDGVRNATDWGDGSIQIVGCLHGQELDQPEPANTGRGWVIYRIASEYDVRYRVNPIPIHSS